MEIATESPRQYSRKDLLASCSFMASSHAEPDEKEAVRMPEMLFSPRSNARQLSTIAEEEISLEPRDGTTLSSSTTGK